MTLGQQTIDDLGTPLAAVDFVVVDLETTGGSAAEDAITEIGAVRVRGGTVVGELQTLVNPGVPVPPFIAALTGITTAAVATAPRIATVLPAFLEFARGGVLVAHNAGFDVGFLKAACQRHDQPWPGFTVIDTARLARVLLTRDEVPNHKLATLARFFHAGTTPNHRALADARATVDVLHGLLERAGGFGAHHLDDLVTLSSRVRPEQRRKRTLADGLPTGPGVYVFEGGGDRPLYVGKAKSIRARVRNYFTAGETRGRILEMVRIAERVTAIPCATELEAAVRELRLITQRQPPYNRRSRTADKPAWLKLTVEPAPRLSVVNAITADQDQGATYVGPFSSRRAADQAREAVHVAYPLRTCTARISRSGGGSACLRAELRTCLAPCRDPGALAPYRALADQARAALLDDQSPIVAAVSRHLGVLAAAERYEDAASARDQLHGLLAAGGLTVDLAMLGRSPQIVAAAPDRADWTVHVIRYGRLAAAARATPQQNPQDVVAAAVATAEDVAAPHRWPTAALLAESKLLLDWLWQPGTRLVRLDGELALPVNPARAELRRLSDLRRSIAAAS